jgi:SOS-response transcriptional repressor LexA
MNMLKPVHLEIYQYIRAYLNATGGVSPTQRQIARRFRYAGVATINGMLNDLRRAGLIDWMREREHSIWLTQPHPLPQPALKTAQGAIIPLRLVPLDKVPA